MLRDSLASGMDCILEGCYTIAVYWRFAGRLDVFR